MILHVTAEIEIPDSFGQLSGMIGFEQYVTELLEEEEAFHVKKIKVAKSKEK